MPELEQRRKSCLFQSGIDVKDRLQSGEDVSDADNATERTNTRKEEHGRQTEAAQKADRYILCRP